LDLTLDKVDRQVVKLKEKIKIERKRLSALSAEAAESGAGDDDDGSELGELERVRLKLRPESITDAEAALETGRMPVHIFLDESSGEINVCFRRPDGGLTIVQP